MSNPGDNTNEVSSSASQLQAQSKKGLREFFQQKSVKNLVSVLVPSALAAVLFPVFGPAVAGAAAAVAIQNGLKLMGVSLSAETIGKVLKPLEGKQIEESDVQDVLQDLLPKDKQVNDEAAKVLVAITPEVKEAALANPKLDPEWLGEGLEISLKEQGGTMAVVAPEVHNLVRLNEAELQTAIGRLLTNWSRFSQEVTVTGGSEASGVEQSIEGKGGQIDQRVAVEEQSKGKDIKQNIKFT